MEDDGILFSWNGTPCSCRCDHCLLASGARPCRVRYEDAKAVVERFLSWREDADRSELAVDFAAGYCVDFPQLPDYVQFRIQHGMQGADALQVGGIRKRSGADLRTFLEELARAGIRRLGVSFHGIDESHDRCTHRRGDFAFLMELVRASADCGMRRFETVFLRRSTLAELPVLLAQLDAIPGVESRHVGPIDYRGRGKLLEPERPLLSDLSGLPASALGRLNRSNYRPEPEWAGIIASGEAPEKTRRYYMIPICEDTIPQLRAGQPEELLSALRKTDEAFRRRIPPLRDLASRCCDRQSGRVYALRDLEWKWTDAYLAEHPLIDTAGIFDDGKPCVLCK